MRPVRWSRVSIVLALMAWACGSGEPDAREPGPPAAETTSAGDDGTGPDVRRADPEDAVERLEARLLDEPVLLPFRVTASGAVQVSLDGRLVLAPDNRARLEARGTFAGTPVDLLLVSDGERVTLETESDTETLPTPPRLNEALALGLTRMGVLHNLARLAGAALPDHAEGGVAQWVRLVNVRRSEDPGSPAVVFDLEVDGATSGSGRLELDEDGMPVQRRQTVRFPQGVMEVVEEYEARVAPAPVSDSLFHAS